MQDADIFFFRPGLLPASKGCRQTLTAAGNIGMISAVNNTISALQAFSKKLGVTAYNIANADTDGFKKSTAVLEEGPGGAVRTRIRRVDTPGNRYAVVEGDRRVEKETSNVDLVEEIPQLTIARRAYEANIKALQAQDAVLGSLLDIIG